MIDTRSLPAHALAATDLATRLAPAIVAGRDEADRNRRMPPWLLEACREAGAFRLFTPRELGGHELPLAAALRVLRELGRLDGPIAWNIWNGNLGFVGAMASSTAVERIWGAQPDPFIANSARTTGTAVSTDDGYVLTGRWDLVSGIDGADWVALFAVIVDRAVPEVRVFLLPRADITVVDTWDVTAMRGTGSNTVVVEGMAVAADMTVDPFATPHIERPLFRIPAFTLASTGSAAVVLGIARAAINTIVELAPTKATDSGASLAERSHAQRAIAAATCSLDAADLLLDHAARAIDDAAEAGGPVTLAHRGALRAAMCHSAEVARHVLTDMYRLGSSSSLYRSSRLGSLFQDGHAAAQHGLLNEAHLETAGRLLLGLEGGVAVF